MDGWMHRQIDGWMEGWMNEWMNEGRKNESINQPINQKTLQQIYANDEQQNMFCNWQ